MGMPGMHGDVAAVGALQRSDLLITLGARFDDRVTGDLTTFAPGAKVIHADIDPAEISKNRYADVPIVGDAKEIIGELTSLLRTGGQLPDVGDWARYLTEVKRRYPTGYDLPEDGSLSPQHVIKRIGELTGPDAYYASGVGQHQMWAAHFLPWESRVAGSTPAGSARWATACPRPWAPRSARRTRSSGASTATAASR